MKSFKKANSRNNLEERISCDVLSDIQHTAIISKNKLDVCENAACADFQTFYESYGFYAANEPRVERKVFGYVDAMDETGWEL